MPTPERKVYDNENQEGDNEKINSTMEVLRGLEKSLTRARFALLLVMMGFASIAASESSPLDKKTSFKPFKKIVENLGTFLKGEKSPKIDEIDEEDIKVISDRFSDSLPEGTIEAGLEAYEDFSEHGGDDMPSYYPFASQEAYDAYWADAGQDSEDQTGKSGEDDNNNEDKTGGTGGGSPTGEDSEVEQPLIIKITAESQTNYDNATGEHNYQGEGQNIGIKFWDGPGGTPPIKGEVNIDIGGNEKDVDFGKMPSAEEDPGAWKLVAENNPVQYALEGHDLLNGNPELQSAIDEIAREILNSKADNCSDRSINPLEKGQVNSDGSVYEGELPDETLGRMISEAHDYGSSHDFNKKGITNESANNVRKFLANQYRQLVELLK